MVNPGIGLTSSCAAAFLCWCLASGPALAAPPSRPDALTIAQRTPGSWQVDPPRLERLFRPAEIAAWRRHQATHRAIDLVDLALGVFFYLLLLWRPGRWLWRRCQQTGAALGRAGPARWRAAALASRVPRALLGDDWAAALLFALSILALGTLLELPTALWREWLDQQAGISRYTAGRWIGDLSKSLLLTAGALACLVVGVYGLVRRFPRRWWLLLALPALATLVVQQLAAPYAARLYNEVEPLARADRPDRQRLARRLQRLARARGVELTRLMVIDASSTTRALNAYISGVGPTRELVLFDTLLERATPAEIEVVVAHELGHDRPRARWGELLASAGGLLAFLWLLSLTLRWGARWMSLGSPGHVATLPLLSLVVLLLFTVTLPLRSARSRQKEREADRAALVLTAAPDAFISLQAKIARDNLADVDPPWWVEVCCAGHPSLAERVGTARWYKRWLARQREAGSSTSGT